MHRERPVETLDLPELEPFRTMKRPEEHHRRGVFVAEGGLVVERLLARTGLAVESLLLTPHWRERLADALASRGPLDVFLAEPRLLDEIVGFRAHQGVMALARVPPDRTLEEVLAAPGVPLLVALDGLTNAENVGVVVRNAAAFGATALLRDSRSAHPFLRRAVRNSMGTVFDLPIVTVDSLAEGVAALEARGIATIAADASAPTRFSTLDLRGPSCIVLGSEGHGLSSEVRAACRVVAGIPMARAVDSLNVGSASAAMLAEAARQRAAF